MLEANFARAYAIVSSIMIQITWRVVLLVGYLILRISPGDACARTGGGNTGGGNTGGGSTGDNPTTTTDPCDPKTDQALLYLDNSAQIPNDFYGKVAATSTCETCATGMSNFYPDSADPVIDADNHKAIGGVTCENFCICEADGTCYQRNDPDTSIVLYPYCDAGTCSVYALVLGNQDTDGIVSTDGIKTITSASQVNTMTLQNLPVTNNGVYPKVTALSCNGCDFTKSCS